MFTNHKPNIAKVQIQDLNRITILGVGLIGGSVGLALKKYGFEGERVGLGRNIDRLQIAFQHDAVDHITTDFTEGIHGSELVILCTPVTLVPMFVKQIIETIETQKKHIIVTDVGSTKFELVNAVDELIQTMNSQWVTFVGGHPMAGSHETGVGSAHADLFEDARCLLTPTVYTNENALQLIENLWKFVGALPYQCSPKDHDMIVGAASHLPHLMASILANTVADVDTCEVTALEFTATGFRDTTRIAAGSPELWTGIFLQNRDVMVSLIDTFVNNLNKFKTLVKENNHKEIERLLLDAQETVLNQRNTLGEK